MTQEYKKHFRKLIQDIADAFIEFIDEIPERNNSLLESINIDDETKPIVYQKGKSKKKPMNLE